MCLPPFCGGMESGIITAPAPDAGADVIIQTLAAALDAALRLLMTMTAFGIYGTQPDQIPISCPSCKLEVNHRKAAKSLIRNFVQNQEIRFRKCAPQFHCSKRSKF